MTKTTETLDEMLDRDYNSSPALASLTLDCAAIWFKMGRREVNDAYKARFGHKPGEA